MTPSFAVAVLLSLAVVLALLRLALRWRRGRSAAALPAAATSLPGWIALLVLQPLLAGLLWFALFPPPLPRGDAVLVLATAGTTPAAIRALPPGTRVLALPEAPALPGVARSPDLASALRAQAADRLRVLGRGLVARDREAVGGLPVAFDPLPLPRGLTGLWRAQDSIVGLPFTVAGDTEGLVGGRAELLDPAGRVLDAAAIGTNGEFKLGASAPVTGPLVLSLRLRDARAALVQSLALPMQVRDGVRPRLLLLAGGPGPELKYLRRWAADAGLPVQARIALGGGVAITDGSPRLDAMSLRALDLVVLDDRAWRGLDGGSRGALLQAVGDGLGLLVRLTGAVDGTERARWRALGFDIASADLPETVQLPGAPGASRPRPRVPAGGDADADAAVRTADAAEPAAPSRQALRVGGDGVRPLLADAAGEPLAAWRARGRGRLGLAWFGDSYRLVLAGDTASHARLWSGVLGTLARARAAAPPWLEDGPARVGQRLVVCAAVADLHLTDPDGIAIALHPERRGDAYCAAAWPTRAGWHRARAGTAVADSFVLEEAALPGLFARADRDATVDLVAAAPRNTDASRRGAASPAPAAGAIPGPRWPWFLGWLLACALGWTLERHLLRAAPVVRG